jgi:hypothetical protein
LSGDDFDKVFGSKPKPTSFTERVSKPDTTGPSDPKEAKAGSGPYKPYGFLPTGNVNETCEVARWIEGTEIPEGIEFQYRFLMEVGFVGEEQLRLKLPDCIVVIDGMYLRDLRKKLARRQVTFVQQYSQRVWPTPPPKGEPLIEKIEVVRPDPIVRVGKNS